MKRWIAAAKAKYRESMLAKIQQLRARHRELDSIAMDYRKQMFDQARELRMHEEKVKQLQNQIYFSPITEANKLLRVIAEIIEPNNINQYELRCWRDDYVQYKVKCNASH